MRLVAQNWFKSLSEVHELHNIFIHLNGCASMTAVQISEEKKKKEKYRKKLFVERQRWRAIKNPRNKVAPIRRIKRFNLR